MPQNKGYVDGQAVLISFRPEVRELFLLPFMWVFLLIKAFVCLFLDTLPVNLL